MLNIYPDTKIYIHAPAGSTSGGPELLHQLADILNNNNRDAFIVYYGNKEHSIPEAYKKYNIKTASVIENNSHNIEVYPEVQGEEILKNSFNTQKFFWWLSVDNFFHGKWDWHNIVLRDVFKFKFDFGMWHLKDRIKCSIYYRKNYFRNKLSLKQITKFVCGYQAEYIHHFLKKFGVKELVPLKDFLNDDHFQSKYCIQEKKDVILYNPKKGFEFTKKLILATPDLTWVPLQNLCREDLIKLQQTAKLYVDFGNHPGKDRLPRECATNGCCIITGKRGSANFFEDVSIPDNYKFDENKASIASILFQIRWTLDHYEKAFLDFESYRQKIKSEKKEFEEQVAKIFRFDYV